MKTLLIVEDDPDIQDYYAIIFAGLEFRVLKAFNGREALALIDAGTPVDLILLDVVLPEMGGEEFFRALRVARGSRVPVVVCSVDEKLVEPLRRIGAVDDTFTKGDPGAGLVALVRAHLGL